MQEELQEFLILQDTPGHSDGEYRSWSHDNTKLLIDLFKKYRNNVGSMEIRNMKRFWEFIATKMNKEFNVKVSAGNCENRWRVIERNYKKYIDHNNTTGRGRKTFEYAQEMDEIFQKKRNVYPEILLSTTTIAHLPVTAPCETAEGSFASSSDAASAAVDDPALANKTANNILPAESRRPLRSDRKKYRVDVLGNIRQESLKYQKDRLDFEKAKFERKMELEEKKLQEKKRRNDLIEERNGILKQLLENNINVASTVEYM